MYVAKTKALISCAVTAQLICAFVFAYAKAGCGCALAGSCRTRSKTPKIGIFTTRPISYQTDTCNL